MRNKLRNKFLLILISLVVISGIALVLWANSVKKVNASWFDENWAYRQTITISNAGSAQTDYQVMFTLDTASLTTDKMQSDCDDIRVTDSSGNPISFWVETGCDSSTTRIWAKVPSIPAQSSGDTTAIFVYYGNPNAKGISSVRDTFIPNSIWMITGDCPTGQADCNQTDNHTEADTIRSSIGTGSYTVHNVGYVTTTDQADNPYGADDNFFMRMRFLFLPEATGNHTFLVNSDDGSEVGIWQGDDYGDGYSTDHTFGAHTVPAYWYGGHAENGTTCATSGTTGTASLTTGTAVWLDTMMTEATGGERFVLCMDPAGGSSYSVVDTTNFPGQLFSRTYAATEPQVGTPANEEKSLGPVISWRFDEGTGSVAKDSVGNATGTISGAAWQNEDMCVSGKCLWFDGSNDVVSNTSLTTTLTGDTTLSLWFKGPKQSSGKRIVNLAQAADLGLNVYLSSAGVVHADNLGGPPREIGNSNNYGDNKWHMLTVVRSGTTYYMYIDGLRVDYADGGTVPTYTRLFLGSQESSNYFNGFIDEVKVYAYARTEAQVKADYLGPGINKGLGVSLGSNFQNSDAISNGLMAYWNLDEASGTRADASGNAYTLSDWNTTTSNPGKYYVAGQFTRASSEALYVADNANLSMDGDMTISGWFYQDSTTTGDRTIFGKGDVLNTKREFYLLRTSSGPLSFFVSSDGSTTSTVTASNFSNTASVWNFVVVWYDSKKETINIQLNGGKVDSMPFTSTPYDSDSQFMIGGIGNTAGTALSFFDGRIDEVRVHKRVLNESERQILYNYAPKPVGYWQFEERTGTSANDSSGKENTGTLTNGPTWTKGKYGAGLSFAGSNAHVTRADDSDFDFTTGTSFSYSAWIKHNTASALEMIIDKYDATAGNGGFKMYMESDGDLTCGIDDDETSFPEDSATSTAATYDDNNWHYVSCVKSGTTGLYLYIDGVLIASDVSISSTGDFANADPLYIGIAEDGTSNDWIGTLDEVKIYNYARTTRQIIEDMNAGHPAGGSPVGSQVGYWKFDEGQGTIAYSSGTSKSNLTLSSMSSPASVGISGWNPNGMINKALSFDGSNDKAAVSSNTALSITGALTISAWIRMQNTALDERPIISKWNSTGDQRGYTLAMSSGDTVCLSLDSDGAAGGIDSGCSTTVLSKNTWYHITAVFTPSTSIRIYINGKHDGGLNSGVDSAIYANTADFQVGGSVSGWNNLFAGDVDEVKVYNYDLTPSEVLLDYNRGQGINFGVLGTSITDGKTASSAASSVYCVPGDTTSCNPPVAEWLFEDVLASGNSVDTSGNGTTLTNNGGATYQRGYKGKAINFVSTSSQYLSATDNAAISLGNTSFTLQAWVYLSSISGDSPIISKVDDHLTPTATTYEYFVRWQSNVSFDFYMRQSADDALKSVSTSGIVPAVNTWHFMVAWYDSSAQTMNLQVDNGRVFTTTGVTPAADGGSTLRLGSAFTGLFDKMNGRLDDVRIYKYVRSGAQKAYDYNRGLPLSWWKMDECQGDIAYDSVGTGSGTLNLGASGQTIPGTCTTNADTPRYDGRLGKINYALDFDGTDDIVVLGSNKYGAALQSAPAITISAWTKIDSYPANNSRDRIFNAYLGSDVTGFYLGLNDDSGNVEVGGRSISSDSFQSATFAYPSLSTWNHLVGVLDYQNDRIKIYINGVLRQNLPVTFGSSTYAQGAPSATYKDSIGAAYTADVVQDMVDGLIDDVKVWGYALTDYQVRTEFNQGAVRFGPATGAP